MGMGCVMLLLMCLALSTIDSQFPNYFFYPPNGAFAFAFASAQAQGGYRPHSPPQHRPPRRPPSRPDPSALSFPQPNPFRPQNNFGGNSWGRPQNNPFFGQNNFAGQGWHGQGPSHNRGHNWHRPHRPHRHHYRDFANVFNDIERKSQPEKKHNHSASNREDDDENSVDDSDDDLNDDFNGRSVVAPGEYPHMAALGFFANNRAEGNVEFKCGGSLISEWFVLTAAHCCFINGQSPQMVKIGDIRLKEHEEDEMSQRRLVAQVHLHPHYNSSFHYNDIALLELKRPIQYTKFVRPIRLWASDDIPYNKLFTMGYGSTSFAQAQTNILTELDLSIVPLDQCNSSMPPVEDAPNGIIESQICAQDFKKNRDTCQGDSGGPLQLNLERRRRRKRLRYYLVGIISYGSFCRSQLPGIYTRVSSYIDWIASIAWPEYFNEFQNY